MIPATRDALAALPLEVAPRLLGGILRVTVDDVPVVVGGIVPDGDARRLRDLGVARVFTPKDFGITDIMAEVVAVVREANGLPTPLPV